MLETEVVGFFVFKVIEERAADYLNTDSSTKILEVKSIAVYPAFQGQGIGSIIFSEVPNIAKEVGVQNCYCVAWKRKDKVAMHNIHINAGFTVLHEIENYWKKDSIEKDYDCPECGNPCSCSAVIYHKQC
jgi:N-acetylglutamate synthase-like GNAT family acetyltransferase